MSDRGTAGLRLAPSPPPPWPSPPPRGRPRTSGSLVSVGSHRRPPRASSHRAAEGASFVSSQSCGSDHTDREAWGRGDGGAGGGGGGGGGDGIVASEG